MDLSLKCFPLFGVGEDLGGDAAALYGVGNDLVNDIVGVESVDAEFVKKARKEGFAAGNPSRQCDFHLIALFGCNFGGRLHFAD